MLNFSIKILLRLVIATICVTMVFYWHKTPDKIVMNTYGIEMPKIEEQKIETPVTTAPLVIQKTEEVESKIKIPDNVKIEHKVPFVLQAPSAQWDDKRYQDACEEASILMTHFWMIDKKTPSKEKTEKMIEELFEAEKEFFGDSLDTSATDTAKFIREHYKYPVSVMENVTLFDLYNVLAEGNIVIVPTDGRKLNNPNFSGGGPERHMLVITGYNLKKKEFITNDPGTRKGKSYKYKVDVLYNAIRDYETGNKKEIVGIKKNVIILKKDF
ncbi:MAG: C39 family peptidase [Candidatus Moranbacteria bacterium]|nr:C39 family peptidase [Candidatus Moranbacteria bacterium]